MLPPPADSVNETGAKPPNRQHKRTSRTLRTGSGSRLPRRPGRRPDERRLTAQRAGSTIPALPSSPYTEDTLVQQTTADCLKVLGWEPVYAHNREDFGAGGLLGRASDREARRRSRARPKGAGREARRLLAHPGGRQELLDGAVHPQGAPAAGRRLHLPGAHRPRRPRRADLQDLRRLRRGGPRPRPVPGRQRRAPEPAAGRAQVARLLADPEVQPGRGPGRGLDAARRRHRHQRRGAPHAVRPAGPEPAQRPAERRLRRLHRHPAVQRRRAHAAGVRRLRVDLRLPARGRGRRHRAALLRHPRRRPGRGRRRPERTPRRDAGDAGGGRHRRRTAPGEGAAARLPRRHRREAARTGGPRLRAPLLGGVGDRQGHAGLHRQADLRADARPDRAPLARAHRRAGGRARAGARRAGGRPPAAAHRLDVRDARHGRRCRRSSTPWSSGFGA